MDSTMAMVSSHNIHFLYIGTDYAIPTFIDTIDIHQLSQSCNINSYLHQN